MPFSHLLFSFSVPRESNLILKVGSNAVRDYLRRNNTALLWEGIIWHEVLLPLAGVAFSFTLNHFRSSSIFVLESKSIPHISSCLFILPTKKGWIMNMSESLEIVEAPKSFSPFGLLFLFITNIHLTFVRSAVMELRASIEGNMKWFHFTLNFFPYIAHTTLTECVCSLIAIQSLLHQFARKAFSTVVWSLLGDGIMMKNCARSLTLRVLMVDVSR